MVRATAVVAASLVAGAQSSVLAEDWKVVGRSVGQTHTFHVGMKMRDFEGLDAKLADISNPKSRNYGKWLSLEEANKFTATVPEVADEVYAWATSTGASCVRYTEALKCSGSTAAVEELLKGEMSELVNKNSGKSIHRFTSGGAVPSSLQDKVTVVTGLSQLPVPRYGKKAGFETFGERAAAADYAVVPSTIEKFYNYSGWPLGSTASSQAPIEFQGVSAPLPTDTATFAQSVGVKAWDFAKDHIIGPYSPDGSEVESTLDAQYIGVIGLNNDQWYWTEADWLFEYGTAVGTQPDAQLPKVHSISYGWYELDQCTISPNVGPCTSTPSPQTSAAFVGAVNQLLAKGAARGVTFLVSTGDSGAHGRTDPGCTDPVTRPAFPAASPYVLAVGATEIVNGVTGGNPEPICKNNTLACASAGYEVVSSAKVNAMFSSGGGFSNVAARPSWQDAVVSKYLQNTSAVPPAGDFNATARGFPDVAALGHNYYIYSQGIESVDGTSCSAPVWGGLIGSINSERLKAGKSVLGFANPAIYQAYATDPTSFNDIVQGDNTCTESACPCPANTGFYAAPGWDATTGLGTPNYGVLSALLVAN